MTALIWASIMGYISTVKLLLRMGADTTATNNVWDIYCYIATCTYCSHMRHDSEYDFLLPVLIAYYCILRMVELL